MIKSINISIAQIKPFGYQDNSKEYMFFENSSELQNHDLIRKNTPKVLLDYIYSMIVIRDWCSKKTVKLYSFKATSKIWRLFHG